MASFGTRLVPAKNLNPDKIYSKKKGMVLILAWDE